jgi:hypothetical protein
MTPEQLVKKYKQKIGPFLDKDDKDVLEAYINMEVSRRTSKVQWWANFWDWSGIMAIASVIILLAGGFGGWIYNINHEAYYATEYQAKAATLKREYTEKEKELSTLLSSCEKENDSLKDICVDHLLEGRVKAGPRPVHLDE